MLISFCVFHLWKLCISVCEHVQWVLSILWHSLMIINSVVYKKNAIIDFDDIFKKRLNTRSLLSGIFINNFIKKLTYLPTRLHVYFFIRPASSNVTIIVKLKYPRFNS